MDTQKSNLGRPNCLKSCHVLRQTKEGDNLESGLNRFRVNADDNDRRETLSASVAQCDQIWQNFDTLDKILKVCGQNF